MCLRIESPAISRVGRDAVQVLKPQHRPSFWDRREVGTTTRSSGHELAASAARWRMNHTCSEVDLRPERHDPGRIDAQVARVIVMLDVEEVDRLGDARQVVELASDQRLSAG